MQELLPKVRVDDETSNKMIQCDRFEGNTILKKVQKVLKCILQLQRDYSSFHSTNHIYLYIYGVCADSILS